MKLGFYRLALLLIIVYLTGCASSASNTDPDQMPISDANSTNVGGDGGVTPSDFSGLITETPDASKTPLIIRVGKTQDLETIEVTNISSGPIDVSGFILFSENLDDRVIIPGGTILNSKESFAIYNGKDPRDGKGYFWNEEFAILNVEDQLLLLNQAGRIIYYFNYYP